MDILCNYQGFKKCVLILVFDAYRVPGSPGSIEQYHNIHVVYTKEAETVPCSRLPLNAAPYLFFHVLHLFVEHPGRDAEGAVAQNDDLLHAVGGGHPTGPVLWCPGIRCAATCMWTAVGEKAKARSRRRRPCPSAGQRLTAQH